MLFHNLVEEILKMLLLVAEVCLYLATVRVCEVCPLVKVNIWPLCIFWNAHIVCWSLGSCSWTTVSPDLELMHTRGSLQEMAEAITLN